MSSGTLDVEPYRKPTSLWRPLSSWSCHPLHVHLLWPVSYFVRVQKLCSNPCKVSGFQKLILELFETRCPEHISLPMLRSLSCKRTGGNNCGIPRSTSVLSCVRLIVPYSPVWIERGLSRVLNSVFDRWRHCSSDVPHVKVAWPLADTHFGQLLKRSSRN